MTNLNEFTIKSPFAVDVSYYEPVMNWSQADPMPQHIIARATYGVRQDTEFLNHWSFAKERGIPRAAYHYWYGTPMYSHQTAKDGIGDQANNFIKQIMASGYSGVEPLWLDLEETGNTSVPNGRNYQALVKQWLDHVERETGHKPGIYSRKDQLFRMAIYDVMPTWIQDYQIWLAWYPNQIDQHDYLKRSDVNVYPAWLKESNLVMWQYTDGGKIGNLIMKDNHRPTTFDFNVCYPGYLESLSGAVSTSVSIGSKLVQDVQRLNDPLLASHVEELKSNFPEVFK